MKALSFNVEGLSSAKAELISNLRKSENSDILCLQETHRVEESVRPRIAGMKLITELPHEKHGSAIFCKIEIQPTNVLKINQDDIELLTIETDRVAMISIYKPPAVTFKLPIKQTDKARILIGNFNSHHQLWGYAHTNSDGEAIER